MKISGFNIYFFFLTLAFYFIFIICNSQEMKLTKKERKEAMKAEKLKDYESLGTLLESRKFVFVTEHLQGTTGIKIYNVIHIDGLRISAQLEDPSTSGIWDYTSPMISPRAIFFEGDIAGWELSENSKNLRYSVKFEIVTTGKNPGIFYNVEMNINADKSASIEIKGRSGYIVYSNYTGYIRTL